MNIFKRAESLGGGITNAALEVPFAGYGIGSAMDRPGELGWVPETLTAGTMFLAGVPSAMAGSIAIQMSVPLIASVAAGSFFDSVYHYGMSKYNDLVGRTVPGLRMLPSLTKGAVSMRQAAMSALQNSPYNVRRVYGREAELIHS